MDVTMRQMSLLEAVIGNKSRSGQQFAAWEAAYGPTDADGYPAQLWDRRTGKINHDVANYMRDHGYDLRAYAEQKLGLAADTAQGHTEPDFSAWKQ